MEKLRELKKQIEDIKIGWDYEENYRSLYNACIDYMNDTQNWDFEDIFEDYMNYDLAEQRAKYELENGGLIRLYYFMGDCNFNNEIFKINAYGNLQDVTKDDFDIMKEEILEKIDEMIESEEL